MIKDPNAIREHYAAHREALARAMDLVGRRDKLPSDAVAFAVRHGLPIWAAKVAIKVKKEAASDV